MSRSAFRCRNRGQILGYRHHGGEPRTATESTVLLNPKGRHGAYGCIVCPRNTERPYYHNRAVVAVASAGSIGNRDLNERS